MKPPKEKRKHIHKWSNFNSTICQCTTKNCGYWARYVSEAKELNMWVYWKER